MRTVKLQKPLSLQCGQQGSIGLADILSAARDSETKEKQRSSKAWTEFLQLSNMLQCLAEALIRAP